jgi:hypothetical protein
MIDLQGYPQQFWEDILRLEALLVAAEELEESKAIYTHPHVKYEPTAAKRVRTKAHAAAATKDIDSWRKIKSYAHRTATGQHTKIRLHFKQELTQSVMGFLSGRVTEKELVTRTRAAFEDAYMGAYRLGLKSSGLGSLDTAKKTAVAGPNIDPHDKEWIKSALQQERRYWNAFIRDVISGAILSKRFTPVERIQMYVDTLDSIFDAGRVISHPAHSIIYWIMNPKKEHCKICLFLRDNSPYTRETLPGIPRDGHTCEGHSRCGCELRILTLEDPAKWSQIRKSKNRDGLLRKIDAIRRRR